MSDFHQSTVAGLSQMLDRKEASAVELAQHFLQRSQARPDLGAYLSIDPETTLAQARAADARRAAGTATPLTGVPIAHKDIFVTREWPTTAASRMLENYRSPFDATVVARLGFGNRDQGGQDDGAGMVTLGKLNCDEFAMGSGTENSAYAKAHNPWDVTRVPGGSSGGSSAAIAARLAPAATGTDTGGSIRQPSAFCGVTGIKPTYGRASRYGMVAFASSLDQAGPMARTAEDCALLLSAMCGGDALRDSTSLDLPAEDYTRSLGQSLEGLRIGVPREFLGDGLQDDVRQAIEAALVESSSDWLRSIMVPLWFLILTVNMAVRWLRASCILIPSFTQSKMCAIRKSCHKFRKCLSGFMQLMRESRFIHRNMRRLSISMPARTSSWHCSLTDSRWMTFPKSYRGLQNLSSEC